MQQEACLGDRLYPSIGNYTTHFAHYIRNPGLQITRRNIIAQQMVVLRLETSDIRTQQVLFLTEEALAASLEFHPACDAPGAPEHP